MRKHLPGASLCLASLLLTCATSSAQNHVLTNSNVNRAVRSDVSPPLRDLLGNQSQEIFGFHEASPVLQPKGALLESLATKRALAGPVRDTALQSQPALAAAATVGVNVLGVGVGFQSYHVPDAPPDVNLAVGDTQVVQWVNVQYAVFDKATGAALTGPINGNALWAGFGGGCQTKNSGDMIAQWDKVAHRWVLFQPVFSAPFLSCFAISTTPDALGTYYRFAFPQTAGFPDYPKLGIWRDAYYQSNNVFNAAGTAFLGAQPCAYERAKMLVGDSSAKQICFLDNSNGTLFDDGMLPADIDSENSLPPVGAPEVFLGSIDNFIPESNVYKYLFHVDFATPANSTFTGVNGAFPIPVASFAIACNGGSCIPQKGTTSKLGSLADRLMYRLAYRVSGSAAHRTQSWVVSHAIVAGTSVGQRWYEFRAPWNTTSLAVYQQGTFAPDNSYRWMGSIAMDKVGNMAMGYSTSSATMYPSVNYTGRNATDPLGTMQAESLIFAGTGSQRATNSRWGDYTSMAIDNDGCTFWYTAEYYTVPNTTFGWSTRVASLKFPTCF